MLFYSNENAILVILNLTRTFSEMTSAEFCDYDVQEVPFYINQEEYWQDFEPIQTSDKILSIIESLYPTAINLKNPIPSTAITTSVVKTTEISRLVATKSLQTPPVSSCLAPKKRQL